MEDKLTWVFREQPTDDFGIDAHIEVVQNGVATGRLLALQIKGGESWFAESAGDGWWFRLDPAHYEYWKSHSLPVAVVLYVPRVQICYWQPVTADTVKQGERGGLKQLVPAGAVRGR